MSLPQVTLVDIHSRPINPPAATWPAWTESKRIVMAMAPNQPLPLASRVLSSLAGPFLLVEANPRPDT